MPTNRREFLETTFAAGISSLLIPALTRAESAPALRIAPFRFDVTPPLGHPLCGGWIKPALQIDDPLESIGFVIVGAGAPIVITAIDWTALLNDAHREWRNTIAKAAGTTPERVAVQCVHQHNAPFVCLEAERILSALPGPERPQNVQLDFFNECLGRAQQAVSQAMQHLQPVTHIATGQAKVEKVAGNRRFLGPDGTVVDWRGSSSKIPRQWDLPEGLIDPWLKTVTFYNNDRKLVSCHYYATHPMSYYGDGRVNSDFVGFARKRRQAEDPGCTHIYFTGCSGNVAAGKYNDASQKAREELTDRIYTAVVASEADLKPQPITSVDWRTASIHIPSLESLSEAELMATISDSKARLNDRIISAMKIGWLRSVERQEPIILSALHVNEATLLHLPAESFVEYQLRAQAAAPERFVATAAYGDDGPWYIPTAEAYPQGGYEVRNAFSAPEVDTILSANTHAVLPQGS
ncbi:hypothetical protein [Planctomicrobium sp. SH664]|uniref:hypothetical protein n=1 Tax=Planctomicrobium sp. SH664 TaxID=3448125 RepID=UPI003F5C0C03